MPKRVLLGLLPAMAVSLLCRAQAEDGNVGVLSVKDADKVEINIRPVYKGTSLRLKDQPYVNASGDTFYIDEFRIYITNFSFAGNTDVICSNSHLFDASDTDTYSYSISGAAPGIYSHVSFTAGVDSVYNVSGANDGDLDPAKGMYWAWNSGYIMAKLEGHSKACKTLHHAFEFHIGGYAPPYNAARPVTLKIPGHFQIEKHGSATVSLDVDVAAWINDVDLRKVNSILTPGREAADMANRYARMFSVENISFTSFGPR